MKDRSREIALMPEFDSEEAFDAYFAEKTAAVAPYHDRQGRLVLNDIHDLLQVVEKVFAGHPEFAHTFSTMTVKHLHLRVSQILNSNRSVQNDKRKRNGTERF